MTGPAAGESPFAFTAWTQIWYGTPFVRPLRVALDVALVPHSNGSPPSSVQVRTYPVRLHGAVGGSHVTVAAPSAGATPTFRGAVGTSGVKEVLSVTFPWLLPYPPSPTR